MWLYDNHGRHSALPSRNWHRRKGDRVVASGTPWEQREKRKRRADDRTKGPQEGLCRMYPLTASAQANLRMQPLPRSSGHEGEPGHEQAADQGRLATRPFQPIKAEKIKSRGLREGE
jgi:hypothetical protein